MQLFTQGRQAFDYLIGAINKCTTSLYIQIFIWRDDGIGNAVANAVLKAADRGVKVVLNKDSLGGVFERCEETRQSFFHKKPNMKMRCKDFLFKALTPQNGAVSTDGQRPSTVAGAIASHVNITLIADQELKDHSKFFLIDGKTLILGGMNIEDKEVSSDLQGRHYLDFMVATARSEVVERFKSRLFSTAGPHKDFPVDFVLNDRRSFRFEAKSQLLQFICSAQRSLDVVMAYFGDGDVEAALIGAALRGIRIRLLVPDRSNIQCHLNNRSLSRLHRESGGDIEIYLSPKMVHGKVLLADEQSAVVGSINFNRSAMSTLSELGILIRRAEEGFIKTLQASIGEEISKSCLYTHRKYNPLLAYLEYLP